MMLVEGEAVRLGGNRAPIDYGLVIVLAGRLKNGKLEQPVGGRVEFRFADPLRPTIVSQVKWAVLHKAGIGKAVAQGEPQEVVPVERAAQALPVQDRILPRFVGHPDRKSTRLNSSH